MMDPLVISKSSGRERQGMSLQHIQYHPCPCCGSGARLITDIEEKLPQKDKQGNLLYRCIHCNITITVDMYGKIKKKK